MSPPFGKGGAAVQSLITHASEALGLWRRTVGRDLRRLFQSAIVNDTEKWSLRGVKRRGNSVRLLHFVRNDILRIAFGFLVSVIEVEVNDERC